MRKAEYRCNHCMIVESKWLMSNDRASDHIICPKCGLESEKIGGGDISGSQYFALDDLLRTEGKVSGL